MQKLVQLPCMIERCLYMYILKNNNFRLKELELASTVSKWVIMTVCLSWGEIWS